ncbi:hypothetical protein ES288_D12G165700v1 [Gossypium darwinii]|uniref:non-specific serine/threonine protein kinase n=1 Tax=Gossypium darwinii TaxID=34276 RepID=A0A5D2AA50_GOSDA|nr:hypothetical protein ES288_D12G164700v1 [Gossypium darwinii]TYG41309.1 hypothetical protein ES288_D12G165700v1 [Gossypium darwinii]
MEKMNIPWLILSLQIFIFFSLNRQLAFGADTISANQSLSGTQTIVSSGGHFVLGFFKPGNSSNYYIGMWYGKVNQQTAVWVANREIPPVHDIHSSELKISNGNLVLFNESQVPIWSTNISSSSSNSVVAVLEDGGNLVLKDGPKSSTPLWQSLDHPTQTWLPGGKLSLNRRTNQSQQLTSWKNSEDPAPEIPNIKLPQHEQSMTVGSISECESTCLKNCSCNAYAYDSGDCKMGDVLDLKLLTEDSSNRRTIYIRLAASEFSSSSNKSGIIIGAVAGTVSVVLCLVVYAMLRWRRGTMRNPKAVEGSLLAFGYRDLQIATKNFSEKLGGGGFGSVFKGMLADSSVIAVKQLERINQGEKQFRTEVSTIGTIQHVNLVRLRGFCSDGARKLLVYDYMPKGSLDAHLVHESNSDALDWKTRYQIALGTARGLVYLHEKCRDCIIHCDIKPENILLDAEFCPKVADFGLAKLVGRDFSRVLTTMRGTRGYLAPEWISGVAITPKADVYSYGMMLFEIVSGRRNSQQSEDGKVRFIPTWAASLITEGGDVLRLNGVAPVEEISRLCKVACWCTQDAETQRPSMGQVVQMLEGVLDLHLPQVPRSLQVLVDEQEHVLLLSESSSAESSQSRSYISTPSHAKSSTSSTTS